MADILCPNCGMPNPDDQNVCSFCRQPLRPAKDEGSIRPGDMPTKKSTAELEPILPQWLREAREKARLASDSDESIPSQPSEKPPAAASQGSAADWLAGLDAVSREDDQDEIPDWMRGHSSSSASTPPPVKPPSSEATFTRRQEISWDSTPGEEPSKPLGDTQSEDGIPDWMKGLVDEEQAGEKKEADASKGFVSPFESGTFRAGTGELSSWLNDVPKPGESAPAASTPEPKDESGLPDWMANLSREESPAAPPPAESTSFDWLKDEASKPFAPFQKSQTPEEPAPEESFGASFDLPDWMKSSDEKPAQPESSWTPPASETPAPKAEEGGALDWLKFADEKPAQPEESGLPDWMKPATAASAPQAEEGGPLDWLKPAAETPAQPEESGLPSWMSSTSEPATPKAEEGGSFDWLTPAAEQPASQESDLGLPDWAKPSAEPSAMAGDFDLPSWMSAQPSETPKKNIPEVPAKPASAPAFLPGEEPIGMGAADELFSSDMPDWLSNVAPSQQVAPAASSQEPSIEEESISPAELPSWVQAMRPVEAALPGEPATANVISQPLENQGPLAGLRGVLQAAVGLQPAGKPKAYSLRLHPSQDQLDHAALLEKTVAAETEPKPFRMTAATVRSQRGLRWLVTTVLLLLITGILVSGVRVLPLPATLSPEGQFAQDAIVALPEGAPVLMIFDYEPALAGEIETASASFVNQMITLHHPRLAILSTSPTGGALAERLLSNSQEGRAYKRGQDYVSLGYLPGENAGILSFVLNPHAAMPVQSAWASPALGSVKSFSDFALVVLLTDRAETARLWVEQTTGHLNGRHLVIVSSAQAAPMIQPYLLSGQVTGLVSGLYEGAAFDQNTGHFGAASRYWDAYNLSILAVCGLIVIGGLWNLVAGWRARRPTLGED